MKKFYTSYYAKYTGDLGVAISAGVPNGFKGERISAFAPSWDLVKAFKKGKLSAREYAVLYLSGLDVRDLEYYADILPDGTVFLCWEKEDKICHRHLLAAALMIGKFAEVSEWNMASVYTITATDAIRAEVFNTWTDLGSSLSRSTFLTPDLKRQMVYHSGIIRGCFQNPVTLTKDQYNELVTAALFFHDLDNPAFQPLKDASNRLVYVVRTHIRKE